MLEKKSSEQGIKNILNRIVEGIEAKGPGRKEKILETWSSIVGREASRHSKPIGVRKHVLTIEIDSSTWFYELSLRKKSIIRDMQTFLQEEKIVDIKFRMGDVEK